MKIRAVAAIAWCALVTPVVAQGPGGALLDMYQDMGRAAEAPVSLAQRAETFSALRGLPADTDSFFAVRGLGDFFSKVAGADASSGIPVAAMGSQLDGFAVGMSEGTVRDLQRLIPLLDAVSGLQEDAAEKWLAQADADAALAIVAQQREARHQMGEQLVAATKGFHLAPVYVVLSSHPDGQMLLYQLSSLLYLLPQNPEGALEWVVQGKNRGICIRGDKLDLSGAGLEPEQEQRVRENLRNVRVYIMMRVVQNRLVFGMTSRLEELRWVEAPAESVLNTERMAAYDLLMQRDAVALGHAGESLVNLRENLNLQSYRGVARFMGSVFSRLAGKNAAAASAAGAVERLVNLLVALTPPRKGAEQLMVWKAEDYYVELALDACGQSFQPGNMHHLALADAPGTVLYAESTMPAGLPTVDVEQVVEDIQLVQGGYLSTVKPGYREKVEIQKKELVAIQPGLVHLTAGLQCLGPALDDSATLLVQEHAAAVAPQQLAAVSLRASVRDSAALAEAEQQFREAARLAEPLMSEQERREVQQYILPYVQVERSSDAVVLHNGTAGLTLAAPQTAVPVEGGFVFSLRLPELARVLAAADRLEPAAGDWNHGKTVADAAQELSRIDGAARVQDGRMKMRFRLVPVKK